MNTLVATVALVLVAQAQAQTNQGTNVQQVPAAAEVQASGPSIAPGQGSGNPIYILNNQRVQDSQSASQGTSQQAHQGTVAVQEQPVTVVQDTPLKVSPADQIRKRRQDAEVQTEDGIVQALEKARIEDEMRRRDKFNNAILPVNQPNNQPNNQPTNTTNPVVDSSNNVNQSAQPNNIVIQQPQQVQQVQPVLVVQPKKTRTAQEELEEEDAILEKPVHKAKKEEEKKEEEKVDIRSEIRAAIADSQPKKIEEEKPTTYVAALASFGTYYNVINVDRSLGYGFSVGTITPDRFVIEGTFMYANFHIGDAYAFAPWGGYYGGSGYGPYSVAVVDMAQYNFGAAAKYRFLPGKFRPVAGALLNYTRRNYTYQNFGTFRTTDAVDVGALVGADLQLTQGFTLGFDFRYNTNVGYRSSNPGEAFAYRSLNDPEKLDYYTLNLIGKFTF